MQTIKEIMQQHEKSYIILKDSESRRRFVSDALKNGVLFTNASLPSLNKLDDIIVLYDNGIIARVGWAGHVHLHNDTVTPRIEY